MHRLRYLNASLADHFRSEYAYTNFGLTAAADAAARVIGMSWEDLSDKELYGRVGMASTSSRYADFADRENRALGHVLVDGNWIHKYDRRPDAQSPAGDISSSARDMARWLGLQIGNGLMDGKQIIDADALSETHRPQIVSRPPADPYRDRAGFYGLGWNVSYDDGGRVRLSHSGAFLYGAGTAVMMIPSEDLGILVLCNAMANGVAESIGFSFLELVLDGKVQRNWFGLLTPIFDAMIPRAYGNGTDYSISPTNPIAALAKDAYVGKYTNDYYGDLKVVEQDGGLEMQVGPAPVSYPLQHWDRDVFLYQPVGENAGPLSAVAFTVGFDGRAKRVVIENLDNEGQGTFFQILGKSHR